MKQKPEHIFFSLFHISVEIHHINKRFEKLLGLSLVQWCLLKHLIDMPATSAFALAKIVGVHPSTLTQTLKRLKKKKYIFLAKDHTDSRKKLISITRSGKNILESTTIKMSTLYKNLSNIDKELRLIQSNLEKFNH